MKTNLYLQVIVLIFCMLLFACSKVEKVEKVENNVKNPEEVVKQARDIDSLIGVWNWHKTYTDKKGLIANEYNVRIKFTKINSDSTIAYQTYKNDSLFKNGDIKLAYSKRKDKIIPNITPFYIPTNELYLRFISKDTIELTMNCPDCPFYYFNK